MTAARYDAAALHAFARQLCEKAGMQAPQAQSVSEILVEGDLLGHTTHGLQLLAPYLRDLQAGKMLGGGAPAVVADRGSALTWDGRFLPGPWLVTHAMEQAFARMAEHPVMTVSIRRSHHIGCLAAYLERATDRGLVMLLMCSDPSVASVAPFGSHAPRFTPNPLAAGFPTDGLPVLIDISASTTTNGMVNRLQKGGKGEKLGGPWLIDNQGNASDDPAVTFTDPPGALLPLGGMELGHKGFGLALIVEALTSALAGYGRADDAKGWGASVFVQIIDPAAFGGSERFQRETGWLAEACRSAPVKEGGSAVRMPGERGLRLREKQMKEGVELHPDILPGLQPVAEKLGVTLPNAL